MFRLCVFFALTARYSVLATNGKEFLADHTEFKWMPTGSRLPLIYPSWPGRSRHCSLRLIDGRVLVLGGVDPRASTYLADAWRSDDDGLSWYELPLPSWDARASAGAVGGLNPLVFGGESSNGFLEDSWISFDRGVTWAARPRIPWGARSHMTVGDGSNGTALAMGGKSQNGVHSDVWLSADEGLSWKQLPDAPWQPRYGSSAATLSDGSFVFVGGRDDSGHVFSDVWASGDGCQTWQQLAEGQFLPRSAFGLALNTPPDGGNPETILVFGGEGDRGTLFSDLWSSTDGGITWLEEAQPLWSRRKAMAVASVPGVGALLMGGEVLSRADNLPLALGDVWHYIPYDPPAPYPTPPFATVFLFGSVGLLVIGFLLMAFGNCCQHNRFLAIFGRRRQPESAGGAPLVPPQATPVSQHQFVGHRGVLGPESSGAVA